MLIFSDILCIKQMQRFAVSFLYSHSSTVYFQSSCVLCFFILNRLLLQTSAHLSSKSFCSFLRKSGQNPSWIQTKRGKHVDSKRIKPAKKMQKWLISFYCILLNYCTHKTFRKVIGLAWTGCSVFVSILTDFVLVHIFRNPSPFPTAPSAQRVPEAVDQQNGASTTCLAKCIGCE